MAKSTFDLFPSQASPGLNGALDDTTAPGFVYQATPFILSLQATGASYEYDLQGRLKKVNFTNGETITYSYDAAGNRTSVVTT